MPRDDDEGDDRCDIVHRRSGQILDVESAVDRLKQHRKVKHRRVTTSANIPPSSTQHDGHDGVAFTDNNHTLEIQPVIRAALAYGRKTYALGALEGAQALNDLASRIKELASPQPILDKIVADAEGYAVRIRERVSESYEDD